MALVTPGRVTPYTAEIIDQVDERLDLHGLQAIQLRHGSDEKSAQQAEDLLRNRLADAAVIVHAELLGASRLARIGTDLPLLTVTLRTTPGPYDMVRLHMVRASRIATQYLLDQGARRPLFLRFGAGQIRDRQFLKMVAAANVTGTVQVIDTPPAASTIEPLLHRTAIDILEAPASRRPDAILATADQVAITLVRAAQLLKIDVPGELMIMGMGNIPEAREVTPALTTVGCENPDYRPAIDHLLARIDDPSLPPQVFDLPWGLIRRGTA